MLPLLIIAGPTAVGKSALAIEIASNLNGEIISADSMQIYKEMNIGTAKPTKDELKKVKHHLIDIIFPDEDFSVADYSKLSKNIANSLLNNNKLPVICGGTGLYINSLLYPMRFSDFSKNAELRKQLNDEALKHGNEYLYNLLKEKDSITAEKLHQNDTKRIIRALEILYETGIKKSEMKNDFLKSDYDFKFLLLDMDREKLYQRIDLRVENMLKNGLIDEVKTLYDKYPHNLNSLQAIGYKEFFPFFKGESNLKDCIDLLKTNSKHYAKRQLTWFKKQKDIEYCDVTNGTDDLFLKIKSYYNTLEK